MIRELLLLWKDLFSKDGKFKDLVESLGLGVYFWVAQDSIGPFVFFFLIFFLTKDH